MHSGWPSSKQIRTEVIEYIYSVLIGLAIYIIPLVLLLIGEFMLGRPASPEPDGILNLNGLLWFLTVVLLFVAPMSIGLTWATRRSGGRYFVGLVSGLICVGTAVGLEMIFIGWTDLVKLHYPREALAWVFVPMIMTLPMVLFVLPFAVIRSRQIEPKANEFSRWYIFVPMIIGFWIGFYSLFSIVWVSD